MYANIKWLCSVYHNLIGFLLHRNMEEGTKPQENGVSLDGGGQKAVHPPIPPPQATIERSFGAQLSTTSSDSLTSNMSFGQGNTPQSSLPNIPPPSRASKLEDVMGNVGNTAQRPTKDDDSSRNSQDPSR